MMLLALSLDGIAGVCGVRGEMRSPGDDEIEVEVPATMGGTLESCLLDELEERWSNMEDDMESDRAALESLMRWNLDRAAVVRLRCASADVLSAGALKLLRSFFWSSNLRKSEILSSSVLSEPELAPPPSAKTPDPG
jgi:hypothetical protein